MKFAHVAQGLTIILLIVTAYLAWEAQSESIRARTKVELMTQHLRAVEAQQAAAHASGNMMPGLTTPMSMPDTGAPARPQPSPVTPVPATASITPPKLPSPSASPAVTLPPSAPEPPATVAAGSAAGTSPVPTVPLTPLQRRVKDSIALGAVKEYVPEQGFVVLSAGADKNVKEGMKFDLRRESSVVGRVTISIVEPNEAVADLDPRSVPEGVKVQMGDEVIEMVLAQ